MRPVHDNRPILATVRKPVDRSETRNEKTLQWPRSGLAQRGPEPEYIAMAAEVANTAASHTPFIPLLSRRAWSAGTSSFVV
jgi:hypothetical protein